jgi:hypothetical protein
VEIIRSNSGRGDSRTNMRDPTIDRDQPHGPQCALCASGDFAVD